MQQQLEQYGQEYFQPQLPLSQNFQQPYFNVDGGGQQQQHQQQQQQQHQQQQLPRKRKASFESSDSESSTSSQQSTLDSLAAVAATAVRSLPPPSRSSSSSSSSSIPSSTSSTTSKRGRSKPPPSLHPQKRIQWTAEEDLSLSTLILRHGPIWTLIERHLVGGRRSNKQCHDRWQSIDPKYERGEWTVIEKQSLLYLVEKYGVGRWRVICQELERVPPEGKPRNAKQCRMQWYNHQEDKNQKRVKREGVKAAKKRLEQEEEGDDDDDEDYEEEY
jgi:hypothetical protein